MRSIEEIRARKVADVARLIRAAGMFATNGRGLEAVASSLLWDLCFIDERESDFEAARDAHHLYGKLGVAGAFDAVPVSTVRTLPRSHRSSPRTSIDSAISRSNRD